MRAIHFYIILSLLFLTNTVFSQGIWALDDAHSNLQFSLVHLMVSDVEGSIKLKSASLVSSGNDFANASLSLVGDMSSIDTDNDSRDEHLRGKDFFDVEKYPDMTFNSTSFKKNSDTSYEVAGLLSFHGVSKQVTLNVIATKNVQPWDNKEMVGFKVKGEINRLDFGISKDSPGAMLSEAAQIKANVIFVNQ